MTPEDAPRFQEEAAKPNGAPAPKPSPLAFGHVNVVGSKRKDEDRTSRGTVEAGGVTWNYYGLFDGHGGKPAADLCAATLHDLITEKAKGVQNLTGSEALAEALRRACWDLDDRLGTDRVDAGTTATILFASPGEAVMGWVGDSLALRVDMLGARKSWDTAPHNPHNLDEVARMKAEWEARREFLSFESSRGDVTYAEAMDEFTAGFEKRLAAHFAKLGHRPMRPGLIRDAMRRETRINDRLDRDNSLRRKQSFESVAKFGKLLATQDMDATVDMKRHEDMQRHDSNFTRRTNPEGEQCGPVVVGTNWKHPQSQAHSVAGASTCVTRSIGDWDASRAVIPEPDCHAWPIPSEGAFYERVVLASDGLWDLIDFAGAEAICRKVPEPQACAERLLRVAKTESGRRGYRGLKDDTTILVIDLNPNRVAVQPEAGCACAVS
eukprot:CAMPEP_0119273626 /NCGR_PEP_ID=MMETSP1329-20130426/10790_1 /TAXON_ID=114041 /ORGANISM="Genus nov. species nov., Strain RCC1024" /LENGTH=436 /DNA_ID=CAMNT_0007273855 /DNA_START=189 /DNA_END=1499 /DNA_ORIENTATION=+